MKNMLLLDFMKYVKSSIRTKKAEPKGMILWVYIFLDPNHKAETKGIICFMFLDPNQKNGRN